MRPHLISTQSLSYLSCLIDFNTLNRSAPYQSQQQVPVYGRSDCRLEPIFS
ncbi:hypothetical protein F383_25291 [Gossypium arboreum]|uniref:Uncharacterized protein n=1 Tax=Gossypium arboreum TaxID=29729 RepID=A0A0B0MNR0_GOSAR|nr:hypothetical protein F383_25291 [Gossypium arboreum]